MFAKISDSGQLIGIIIFIISSGFVIFNLCHLDSVSNESIIHAAYGVLVGIFTIIGFGLMRVLID
jgi:hypothetical protein